MERDFQLVRLYVQKTLTAKDTAEAQALGQQADTAAKELEEQLSAFSKTLSSAEDETLYKQIVDGWGAYNRKRPMIMEMKQSGKTNEQIMAYVNAELVPTREGTGDHPGQVGREQPAAGQGHVDEQR